MRGFLALFGLEPCGLQFSLCYVEIADVQCSSWFQRYLWKVEKALKSRSSPHYTQCLRIVQKVALIVRAKRVIGQKIG